MIPFGVGLKYLCNERIAVRVDLIDEMTFGGGVALELSLCRAHGRAGVPLRASIDQHALAPQVNGRQLKHMAPHRT